MKLLNLIGFVSAHTGNDLIVHGMGWFDWVLTVVLVIGGILLARRIIKGKKKLKNK